MLHRVRGVFVLWLLACLYHHTISISAIHNLPLFELPIHQLFRNALSTQGAPSALQGSDTPCSV